MPILHLLILKSCSSVFIITHNRSNKSSRFSKMIFCYEYSEVNRTGSDVRYCTYNNHLHNKLELCEYQQQYDHFPSNLHIPILHGKYHHKKDLGTTHPLKLHFDRFHKSFLAGKLILPHENGIPASSFSQIV